MVSLIARNFAVPVIKPMVLIFKNAILLGANQEFIDSQGDNGMYFFACKNLATIINE
jgi:hypothetical protein